MDKLKKNRFLAAMGAVGIVAAIGFGIFVYPLWGEAAKSTKTIQAKVTALNKGLADIPGDPNVDEWTKHAAGLKARYAKTLQDLLAPDKSLGQWFEDLDDTSTFAVFMNRYDDERAKLEAEVIEKGVLLGSPKIEDNKVVETKLPGFNWVQRADITRANNNAAEMQAKEILQKRFNISRAVVNAVIMGADKKPYGRPRRLLDVSFLERFPFSSQVGGIQGDKITFEINVDHKRYPGYMGPGSSTFSESSLPSNGETLPVAVAEGETPKPAEGPPAAAKVDPHLGKTLTFGFAVVMEYSQVPELLRNLLNPAVEPVLNLSIVGVNVFVANPNAAEKKEFVQVEPGENTDAIKAEFRKKTEECPPPQVHVYVTCQVYDIDPAAVPGFLKP